MTERETAGWPKGEGKLATFFRENALSLAAAALFLVSAAGQAVTGLHVANDEAVKHGRGVMTLVQYLGSGDFVEALFENWESEFLQMGVFVLLTKFLRQKGSSESKSMAEPEEVDEDPRKKRNDPDAPWPVRRGGIVLALYERSLLLALLVLFAVSFVLHGVGGASKYNGEQLAHGGHAISTLEFFGTSEFWFQSFQNWQSEFLSVAALVLLSVFLREKGSPQSKPVAAPHAQTGE